MTPLEFVFTPFEGSADGREWPGSQILTTVFPCCGTEAKHAWRNEGPVTEETIATGKEMLKYWANNRYERHQCALVSEGNPLGLPPKVAK